MCSGISSDGGQLSSIPAQKLSREIFDPARFFQSPDGMFLNPQDAWLNLNGLEQDNFRHGIPHSLSCSSNWKKT